MVVAAVLLAPGCGDPPPFLTQDSFEDAVTIAITDEAAVPIVELECPDVSGFAALAVGASATVECGATLAGDAVVLVVTLERGPDDTLATTVDLATPILDVVAAASTVAARLAADLGGEPEVVCAEARVVIAPGREVACRVTAEGGTGGPVDRAIVVRVLDVDGTWEIDLAP